MIPTTPSQAGATSSAWRAWGRLFILVVAIAPSAPAQSIPPGFTQAGCMVLPDDVLYGDSVFTAAPWPGGMVGIVFDPTISSTRRDQFRIAMAEIEAISQVRFIETLQPQGWINVINNPDSNTVSWSMVGFQGGPQNLAVGANHWNNKYILVHELFHALGFLHEQSRVDRDNFITINHWNISQTACGGNPCNHNFAMSPLASPVGPYDFLSIMHYGQFAFSMFPGVPTIQCKPGYTQFQDQIGNRTFMTARDAQGIAARYGAPSAPAITGLSQTDVAAGSPQFWLTVTGTQFFGGSPTSSGVQGTKVVWDQTELQTVWLNKNTVRATVPANLLATAGTRQIRVKNDVNAGGLSAPWNFTVNAPPCGSSNDRVGYAVVGLGDVNGDGVPDYAIGTPGYGANQGIVRVRSGATHGLLWQRAGTSGQRYGHALSAMPDINGDGRKELLVGMPGANSNAGGFQILNGANGVVLAGVGFGTAGAAFGWSVAAVGDLDGDGDQDFVIGAPDYDGLRGRVEVWSTNGGLMRAHNGVLGTTMRFGASVGGGYDVNGDGRPDYVVGSPQYNGSAGASTGRISIYSGTNGALLAARDGDGPYDYLGTSVAIVPSITGASTASPVAGAPQRGPTIGQATGPGYVRVYRGSSAISQLSYNPIRTWPGAATGDRYGWYVGNAGDLDCDGNTEILIGATQMGGGLGSPATGPGYVDIRSGLDGRILHTARRGNPLVPPPSGIQFGWSADLIGDIDSDGHYEYIVGVPFSDVPCSNAGDIDIFFAPIPPALGRVLITEVNAGTPDGVEICNFGDAPVNLNNWSLRWKDGNNNWTTGGLGITIDPGEIVIITETGGSIPEKPAHVRRLALFPSIGTQTGDFAVALINGAGRVVDEVRVESATGSYTEGSLGGKFRGTVVAGQSGPPYAGLSAERIWGLDSNSGADWYGGGPRSFGLENACSGTRGIEPLPHPPVVINEIDDSPDLMEIYNSSTTETVDMRNWYILTMGNHGSSNIVHIVPPFASHLGFGLLFANEYAVIGDSANPPAEKPQSVPYINTSAAGQPNIPWSINPFSVGLYDNRGRLVDHVRVARRDTNVAHNHPRLPSAPGDFRGHALRTIAGDRAVGRNHLSTDTNRGADWTPIATRTMGSANNVVFHPPAAHENPPPVDVRLHSGAGTAIHIIVHAGPERAGAHWSFAASAGHLNGTGPLLGLGPDAIQNYLVLSVAPGFAGILDSHGVGRSDFPPGILPPGVSLDTIFFLVDPPTGNLLDQSGILMFDTF